MIKDINQEKGIDRIESNVAINAGAGTGKTRVLVERFMNILENGDLVPGHEIQSIVAITFTKKAAEEMTDRIRGKLSERLGDDPKWSKYYRDMDKANISTIHSFCANILREHPIESDVDPMFKILEGRNSEVYLEEAIIRTINETIKTEVGYNFFKSLDLNHVLELISDLKAIYLDLRTYGDTYDRFKQQLDEQFENLLIREDAIEEIRKLSKETLLDEELSPASNFFKMQDSPEWIAFRDDDYQEEELEGLLVYIYSQIGTSNKEGVKRNFEKIKKLIDKSLMFFEKNTRSHYELLLDIIFRIDCNYSEIKEREGYLDYDDLQIKVNSLLKNPKIRNEYQERYRYIMVDECQDTNELQKEIFYKLSSRHKLLDMNNLFVVGDPKQSIYRFRGADLDVFYDMVQDIREIDEDNEIVLKNNYRTSKNLMDEINNIFEDLMGEQYNPLEGTQTSNRLEGIEVIKDENNVGDYREIEADLIARRIRKLVEEEAYSFKDIGILLKSTSDVDLYENSLREYGIPYYNNSGRGFFQTQEVLDLTNAIKSIFNPSDLIANIGFLRSPMMGGSDETIFKLMQIPGDILNKIGKSLESEQFSFEEIEFLRETKKTYEELLDFNSKNGAKDLIEKIIDITDYREIVLLKENSRQILGNINKFIDFMLEFDMQKIDKGIDFLDYLEFINSDDEGQFNVGDENSDVVNILTIHKSKGLEFPVVFIPDLSRQSKKDYSKFKYQRKLGFGIKLQKRTKIYDLIINKLFELDDEEEVRLLYVAMTRAEELLILGSQGQRNTGFRKILGKHLDKYPIAKVGDRPKAEDFKFKRIDGFFSGNEGRDLIPPHIFRVSTENMDRTDRISVTRYNEFVRCRRRYYYKYIEGISQEDLEIFRESEEVEVLDSEDIGVLDPKTRGDIIHDFCYRYRSGMDSEILLKEVAKSEGFKLEDVFVELNPYIKIFIKNYESDTKNVDRIYREKEFFYKKDQWSFTGSVDRIDISGDEFKIIDYKTGYPNKKYLDDYVYQIQFYGYMIEKILNKKAAAGEILFLSIDKTVYVDMDSEMLAKRFNEIYEFARWISKNKSEDSYEKSADCMDCQYEILCRK